MSAYTPRIFEVPAALVAAGFSPSVDLDVLDREVEFPGAVGDWAEKVLSVENAKILDDVCGSMRLLPRGILSDTQLDDGSIVVAGLVNDEGRIWDREFNAWGTPSETVDVVNDSVALSDDEVAYVARSLREGADLVWFRPVIPKAFVSAVVAAPAPPFDRQGKKSKLPDPPPDAREVPAGSAIIAVVDPIDEDAVLEMLAITPGPGVLRRHDGSWFDDPEWVPVLRSVKPPKIVKLTEAQVASVTAQIDRSTNDTDWEPFDADTREQYQIFTASAGPVARSPFLQKLQNENDEKALFALVALAGREVTPKDVAATERLKRYWTIGKGAAKIRWGTPGSWTRCHRHLMKYMTPSVAAGYCMNLCQRLGGSGVACHVGTDEKRKLKHLVSSGEVDGAIPDPVTAANPSGKNGYSNGASFEEATGGVQRDYHGRFAPEGGSARSTRRNKSTGKSRSSWYDEQSTVDVLPDEKEVKKAERDQARAKREAQRAQLAQLTLKISEATARGDTVGAAELRVERAQMVLSFADTTTERLNAQAALNNAMAALARARRAQANRSKSSNQQSSDWEMTAEERARERATSSPGDDPNK